MAVFLSFLLPVERQEDVDGFKCLPPDGCKPTEESTQVGKNKHVQPQASIVCQVLSLCCIRQNVRLAETRRQTLEEARPAKDVQNKQVG